MVADDDARAAAQEILAQHRFARWEEDYDAWIRAFEALVERIPAWLINAFDWVAEVLIEQILGGILRAFGSFLGLFGVFGETPDALGWFAVVLLLVIAIVLGYRVWGSRFFNVEAGVDSKALSPTHADAIAEANRLASHGEYLEAAHQVQLATLAMLIERDWLELARSDPNRTLRQRVASSSLPEVERGKLIALVDRLEALWFDEPRNDRDLFEEWIALDGRLARLAMGGAV